MSMMAGVPREIVNSWVLIPTLPPAATGGPEDEGPAVGFLYVDHRAGVSVNLASRCAVEDGVVRLIGERFMVPDGKMILLRMGSFDPAEVRPLSEAEVHQLDLENPPSWLSGYGAERYAWLRDDESLDPFRAPGYPDDVKATVIGEQLEEVWVRLEVRYDERTFAGTLLNTPFQEQLGLKRGDPVLVQRHAVDDWEGLVVVGQLKPPADAESRDG